MAVKFTSGTAVKQVMPAPVTGVVARFVFDEVSGDIHYVVVDDTGHEWSFREAAIEAL